MKRLERQVPARPTDRDATDSELERARDTVAALLRAYGSYAFDIGEESADAIRSGCNTWAQQILLGPTDETHGDRRDYGGARAFLSEQRRRESEYVQRSLRDLRQAIWLFVRGLSQAVMEDRAADEEARGQLMRLLAAVDSSSAEVLRREAAAAVDIWGRHLDQRQQRQRQQLKELGGQLQAMRSELQETTSRLSLDPVTRLPDRSSFLKHLDRQVDLALVLGRTFCLLLVTLDRPGGRGTGEVLLKELGRQLVRQFFRRDDFVARYADTTFAAVLADAPIRGALAAAERTAGALRLALSPETVSMGLVQHRVGERGEVLLARARAALEQALQEGGDRVGVG